MIFMCRKVCDCLGYCPGKKLDLNYTLKEQQSFNTWVKKYFPGRGNAMNKDTELKVVH